MIRHKFFFLILVLAVLLFSTQVYSIGGVTICGKNYDCGVADGICPETYAIGEKCTPTDTDCPVCLPGKIQTKSCGKCGTQTRTCDANGQWPAEWSACTGEGVCAPGTPPQSCTTQSGQTGTQTCNSLCAWDSCTSCAPNPTPPNYGASCNCNPTCTNLCGGAIGCDGKTCSGATPALPVGYGTNCNCNACNQCGGAIGCDGKTCSGATPALPAGYGAVCNACGGTIQCDGTCPVCPVIPPVIPPEKPLQPVCNPVPEVCNDGLDNDCDGLIDCSDSDCSGSVAGTVRNQDNNPINSADVNARQGSTTVASTTTNQQGTYTISNLNCGSYNLAASHESYAPQTKTVNVPASQQATADFNLFLGSSCEQDCTFADDEIIHASCDGRNGCSFYDAASKAVCDNSQPGWIRDYNSTHYVVCASGSPQPKIEIQASVSCASGTLVKVTRIVSYKGKPVKLVVATCG